MAAFHHVSKAPGHVSGRSEYVLPLALIMLSGFLILFTHLGMLPLWGSEGRWAVISRYMFQTGDLGSPILGQSAYWDKPLLSYWQVLPLAFLSGTVNEFVARVPSALWALVLLFLTFDLARRWFDLKTAVISCGILLSSYGFVFWGRNAQVEMTNAAVIMACLWYFLLHRSSTETFWVYVLGIMMGFGANMKGLTAYAVPLFCILIYSLVKRDWSWLPPMKTILSAALISCIVFLLIPALGMWESWSLQALEMVWHENVVRFFMPFDHKGPFYTYLLGILELGAPWALLVPPALIYAFKADIKRDAPLAGIIALLAGVFLFFTISGSRRPYYLLPILPFSSIIIGDFLAKVSCRQLPRAAGLWTAFTGSIIGLLLIVPFVVFLVKPDILPLRTGGLSLVLVAMSSVGIMMLVSAAQRHIPAMIGMMVLTWGIYVGGIIPIAGDSPDNIRNNVSHVVEKEGPLGFLYSDDAKLIFYLNRPYRVFQTEQSAYIWAETSGGILISYEDLPASAWKSIAHGRNWTAFRVNQGLSKAEQKGTRG